MGAVAQKGRRIGRVLRAALAMCLLAMGLLPGIGDAWAAKLIGAKGAEPDGFGRITLTFDTPVSVKGQLSGSTLVLTYGERATPGPEKLTEEMPAYVAAVRRDPDGTGLRVALNRRFRVSVQEAGEQVFVDLLPESWTGLPPPLPPDVVAELARRARAAEAALKLMRPPPAPRPLIVELAHLPTLTRLSVRVPDGTRTAFAKEGAATRLRVSGAWTIDAGDTRGRLKPALSRLTTDTSADAASLLVVPAEGYSVETDRDEDTLILDIVKKPAPKTDEAPAAATDKPAPPANLPKATTAEPAPAGAPEPVPVAPERQAGSGLVFAFPALPPVALFERAGTATLAFETPETVTLPPLGETGLRPLGQPRRIGNLAILQFAVPENRLIDLVPVRAGASPAWELTAGPSLSPSDTLPVTRRPDALGQIGVGVALKQPGGATWLDLDGERIALVTTSARRPAGIAKRQRFVDFDLLPSRIGVAILAHADDLTVRPDIDGVAIGRDGGLALSSVARLPDEALAEAGTSAIVRMDWLQARAGDVRETIRAQFAEAVAAPLGARGPLRLALAHTYIANGFDPEGLAVLSAASADDALLAVQRETAILRAVALAQMGRNAEARQALAAETLKTDPEAALWRAVADAQAGDWRKAESGFLKTLALTERYPDDLAGWIRTLAAESALENGDAQGAMDRIGQVRRENVTALLRDRLAYLRARVEEVTGAAVAAMESYGRLAEAAERPVATAAALRGTLLAQTAGTLALPEAIDRLERLAITWHGGETEDAITAGLARLYAAGGRWREAFRATKRANAVAPNSPVTRALTSEAQALFDDLFLTSRGDKLNGIEAVALYFDHKEFAPIGRRGDEVVRRLADRLVGLDLLDSAADLLQHQVDHRLTGPARAGVAARLAAVRLMDGKPILALEAIDATHMAELPAELRRARALIRARALSDLTRTDLALETIEGEAGPDVQRLRGDILWAARRWREAGEAHEALLGEAWRAGKALDDAARADVIRAAIAYDLSGDAIGLERLKVKFSGAMAESDDARSFALLTGANPTRQPGFREIAQRATSAQTLAAFLAEYRKRYPEAAVPDRGRPAAETRADAVPPASPG